MPGWPLCKICPETVAAFTPGQISGPYHCDKSIARTAPGIRCRRRPIVRYCFPEAPPSRSAAPEFYHDDGNIVRCSKIPAISASTKTRGRDDQQTSFPSLSRGVRNDLARRRLDDDGAGRLALPVPCRALDRALRGGRRHRRAFPPDLSAPVGAAGPALRGREQAGRRQQYRHPGGDRLAARRLYLAAHLDRERHQRLVRPGAAVRLRQGHRAGRGCRPHSAGAGGQQRPARPQCCGIHRLRQGQSGQD